jgi:glucose/arabinose dehydrogenase/mono/diheme cytochrome c family protein
MLASRAYKIVMVVLVAVIVAGIVVTSAENRSKAAAAAPGTTETAAQGGQGCPANDTGLKLPTGFCATIFAEGVGHTRHIVVTPDGTVYANTWSGEYFGNDKTHEGGFLVALQDKSGAGKADTIERFGGTEQTGDHGGSGIGIFNGSIYAETNDSIVKYAMTPGSIVPKGSAVTVVSGLPLGGDHPMHPFIITSDGSMLIDVATATNSCQAKNRTLKSPGDNPCKELETRGGIWRYDANKTDQKFSPSDRYATGIRNGEGFAIDASGQVFVTQHGRDQLHTNWPEIFKAPGLEATLPAEEVLALNKGGDYGWPYCFYDNFQQKLILAPEYGGDGKKTGMCDQKTGPAAAFPAHWGPNGMTRYDKDKFPARYRDGLFIAFHGSWNRAPFPQGGYNIVFQPMSGAKASAKCEIFADGFAGAVKSPEKADHRPDGVAAGPDGALYISDDIKGRIYRVTWNGGSADGTAGVTACPSLTAGAGTLEKASAKPPEGTNPDAGKTVPKGATPAMVAAGDKLYHTNACIGCHGDSGQGTTIGPPLVTKEWLWSDGSWSGIAKTITEGVQQPKKYRSPMPAMGGAQLTPQQVKEVAAYVWSMGHR